VSETTGKYYYFDGVLKIIRKDDPHDVWYYDFKDLHQDYDITVDTNEAAQSTLTVFINHRLNDYDNNFLGVTGVGLELQRIINLLNVYQVKYNRDIYLVDRLGIIEAHPGGRMLGSNIYKEEGLADIAMDAMSVSEVSGFYEFDRDGDHILLTVRYIPELDWFLFVEHNQSQSLEDVRKNLWQNMLLGLIVSIIIIFINILTVNFFQGRLEKLATTDELTGAMNRRAFGKAFADAVYFSERSGTAFSLIIFDVDCFKEVNDTLGHLTGDIILKRVLAAARENIRQVDTIARWGGDEFIVLAHGGEEISTAIAERIRTGVESIDFSDCVAEGRTLQVSISCGVTEHKEGETAEDAVRRADKALYEAKNAGRNKVVFNTSL
jgi:diguanylate cyclase (GGDEF)-like protein